ncbi:MAG: peptide chain release factor-like protein [Planctomycetota bacterium]
MTKHCEFRRQRRSGPGGQHRNKVETGIFVTHTPTGIEAAATEKRSQLKNRETAIERLRVELAIIFRVPNVNDDGPSQLWQTRCRNGRIVCSRNHFDFAAILAEALDALGAFELDFAQAAEHLGCTRSQLTKLLSMEPAALTHVNRLRAERGQKPLSPR